MLTPAPIDFAPISADEPSEGTVRTLAEVSAHRTITPYVAQPSTAMVRLGGSYEASIIGGPLDYTVSKHALVAGGTEWPGAFGIVRDDNGHRIPGAVGNQYTPFQNADMAKTLDTMFADFDPSIRPQITRTALWRDGEKASIDLALPQAFRKLLSAEHALQARVSLRWGHGPSGGAAIFDPVVYRFGCENVAPLASMLAIMAYRKAKASVRFKVKHTTGNAEKLQAKALAWFKGLPEAYKTVSEAFEALKASHLAASQVERVVRQVLIPDSIIAPGKTTAQAEAKVATVLDYIENRDGEYVPVGDVTAYSVLNAFTAYARHSAPVRVKSLPGMTEGEVLKVEAERRTERIVYGEDKTAEHAFKVLWNNVNA